MGLRCRIVFIMAMLLSQPAMAQRVVVAIDGHGEAVAAALILNHQIDTVVARSPLGATELSRAGAAQALTNTHEADFAVWAEPDGADVLVRAVMLGGASVVETRLRHVSSEGLSRTIALAASAMVQDAWSGGASGPEPLWFFDEPELDTPPPTNHADSRHDEPDQRTVWTQAGSSHVGWRDGWIRRTSQSLVLAPRLDPFWGGNYPALGVGVELAFGRWLGSRARLDLLGSYNQIIRTGPEFSAGVQLLGTLTESSTRLSAGAVLRGVVTTECDSSFQTLWWSTAALGGVAELAFEMYGGAIVSRLEIFGTLHPERGVAPGMSLSMGWEWH